MRERIVSGLDPLGIELDPKLNDDRSKDPFRISTQTSRTAVWVIPTNEELMIARDTARLIS
jgi:acetate kinase